MAVAELMDNTLTRTSVELSIDSNWIIIVNLLGGHRAQRFTYNGVVSLRDFFYKHALLCKASDCRYCLTDWWMKIWLFNGSGLQHGILMNSKHTRTLNVELYWYKSPPKSVRLASFLYVHLRTGLVHFTCAKDMFSTQ